MVLLPSESKYYPCLINTYAVRGRTEVLRRGSRICAAAQLRGNIDCKQTLIFRQSVRVQFRQKELGWFVVNSMMKLKKIYEKLIQIVAVFNIRETLYSIFCALVCRSIGLLHFSELWHILELFNI